jgi:serine protease Do
MAVAEVPIAPATPVPAAAAAAVPSAAASGPLAGLDVADLQAVVSGVVERVQMGVVEVRTRGAGAGAGTIWRPEGTIVTNHHVVPGDRAQVTLADGRAFPARVTARDPYDDLAVLEIDANGGALPALVAGDARALRAGELVLAVGHPFGVRGAVTVGIVNRALGSGQPNGRGRRDGGRELLRADVLLGPGNSGGPLVDARGRVVGINAMVHGGLALAVPVHVAERLIGGRRDRPVLGIEARPVALPPIQAAAARRAAVHPDHTGDRTGAGAVLVVGVAPGGPADRAGMALGDVLVAVDHQVVDGTEALLDALQRHGGGPIRARLLRGDTPVELLVQPGGVDGGRGQAAPTA